MKNLTAHFSVKELECKCGCGTCLMNPEFLSRLEDLRVLWNQSMIITSGYRCNNHNVAIKGSKNSQHLQGRAVDVHLVEPGDRFKFLKMAIELGFSGIGVDKTFIHLDNRLSTPIMWIY